MTSTPDNWVKWVRKIWDCGMCGEEVQKIFMPDCKECGRGIGEEERNMTLVGYDAVQLFPSLESKQTGRIIREEVKRSKLVVKAFSWRQAAKYISMNRNYTGELEDIEKFLPKTKTGKTRSMRNKDINSKKEKLEDGWVYGDDLPNKHEERELLSRVIEIGLRMIFENFCYQFGGDSYKQQFGGPIGNRVTMAASRVTMQHWGRMTRLTLESAMFELMLLTGYVDDVRKSGTSIRLGLRYEVTTLTWSWSEDDYREDLRLRSLGESRNERMSRICLPVLNSINANLTFTAEYPEQFPNARLPTLDFELWLGGNKIRHNYYQKEMRTPFTVMSRTAMSHHSQISILSNELIRRLNKIDPNLDARADTRELIEVFTK